MAPIKPRAAAKAKDKDKDTTQDETMAQPAHVGLALRAAREQRHMTVEAIADELMIRRFYLDAIEQGSFKDLPERVYATGFIRSYAQLVGLDPVATVEQFKRQVYGSPNASYRVELTMPEPVVQTVVPSRTALISAGAALVVIALGIFFATRDSTPVPSAVPVAPPAADNVEPIIATPTDIPSPEAIGAANAEAPASFDLTTPQPTQVQAQPAQPVVAPAVTAQKEIFIEALKSSWLEVKDAKGAVLFTSILKEGQKLPIPAQDGITISTGNAGGLRLIVDGQAQQPFGKLNEVKRNVALPVAAKN